MVLSLALCSFGGCNGVVSFFFFVLYSLFFFTTRSSLFKVCTFFFFFFFFLAVAFAVISSSALYYPFFVVDGGDGCGLFVLLDLFGFVSENACFVLNFLRFLEKLVPKQDNYVFVNAILFTIAH